MPLRLTCPHCQNGLRLEEPLPPPGDQLLCDSCDQTMVVRYPDRVLKKLRAAGKKFRAPSSSVAENDGYEFPSDEGFLASSEQPLFRRPKRTDAPAVDFGAPRPVRPTRAPGTEAPQPLSTRAAAPSDDAGLPDEALPETTRFAVPPPSESAPAPEPRLPPTELIRPPQTAPETIAPPTVPAVGTREAAAPPVDTAASASAAAIEAMSAASKSTASPAPDLVTSASAPLPPGTETPSAVGPEASSPPKLVPPKPPAASADDARSLPSTGGRSGGRRTPRRGVSPNKSHDASSLDPKRSRGPRGGRPAPRRGVRGWLTIGVRAIALLLVLGVLAAIGGYYGARAYYMPDLPSVETLRAYEPATVTTVHASDGTLLGEIYEERRYVRELDALPKHVIDAFVAAEDANFWNHGGIDYMGIARAMGRNLKAGRVSQGGSTITQQVAKTFLLSSDRRLERKIKEAFLSWLIEDAYTKNHILYLYLNQIFLGSQAYGVEAASRTFFGKHVDELTLGEAAVLAGLPPRPSSWNPHANMNAAKNRQAYVLGQMVINGFITEAEADAAAAEALEIVPRGNTFLEQAPHFTEYARRYLVERYGEDKVLNEGLRVDTTCDLDLQRVAQESVTNGVHEVDQRMGFRRDAIVHLADADARDKHIAAYEDTLRARWAKKNDATGKLPLPEKSQLEVGSVYEAVLTEVDKTWVRARIGIHEGIVPIAWARWAFVPDPERSWRYRKQDDFTRPVDANGDGEKSGGILRVGDVVEVRLEAESTAQDDIAKVFRKTPAEKDPTLALRLWQDPEVESALLSIDIPSGAVRAMVGGSDFRKSQFNRAVQSYRQVGSTFKPIVYAAALQTERLTAATLVPDAPLAFANTHTEDVWKPSNYGDDFLGNITLRKALAMSRNTCTVRILDIVDPGMQTGVVSDFARALGIGGEPTHMLPEGWVPTPDTDHLCPWVPEDAEMYSCKSRHPPLAEGVDKKAHKEALEAGAEHVCRECDLSIALGSVSLTMEELVRAYAAFANGGTFVQPYYIETVRDRDGKILERHEADEPVQVMEPETATLATWLLQNVVEGGTASAAKRELNLTMAGKTGTTNDEKDAWFVGYTPDVLTAVWVGYDQPRSLGASSTGGRTALPIWVDYMREAVPEEKNRPFPTHGKLSHAQIDEETGRRVSSGGRRYPFIRGTEPEESGYDAGQASLQDLTTEL